MGQFDNYVVSGAALEEVLEGMKGYVDGGIPILSAAPSSTTTAYTKDGNTIPFEAGQFARVANVNNPNGYDVYQLYDLSEHAGALVATWVEVTESTLLDVANLQPDDIPPIVDNEHVTVWMNAYTDLVNSKPAAGVDITVTVDDESSIYTTGQTGMLSFNVPKGKQYTMVIAAPEGYYVYGGRTSYAMYAETDRRNITVRLMPYQTGLFIVDSGGHDYRFDDWKAEVEAGRKNNTEAKMIKVASAQLCEAGGVFGIDIDDMRERNFVKYIWGPNQLISPPGINAYTYNGLLATEITLDTAIKGNINLPAATAAFAAVKTIGGVDVQGFLPARDQWQVLWALRLEVDDILLYTRPDGEYLLSTFTEQKWCITQFNASVAYYWTTAALDNFKYNSCRCVPFFAL